MSTGRMGWKAAACWDGVQLESIGRGSGGCSILMSSRWAFAPGGAGEIVVDVHQVVHDREGKLLLDQMVQHV
jgi:hypothetical protein